MKKFKAWVFYSMFTSLLSLFTPKASYAQNYPSAEAKLESPGALSSLKEVEVPDYEFLPASQEWMEYVADQKPAEFANVKYSYTDKVVVINKNITDKITSAGQLLLGKTEQKLRPEKIIEKGGYIPISFLDGAASEKGKSIEPGSIVVDESTATAFKVVAPITDCPINSFLKGNYAIAQPELHEIISDFTLPDQTISLSRGNISGFAENVEKSFVKPEALQVIPLGNGSNPGFKYISKNPMINFSFDDVTVGGHTKRGFVEVSLSGGWALTALISPVSIRASADTKSEWWSSKECYLAVTLKAELNEETLDTPAEDRCKPWYRQNCGRSFYR